MFPLGTKTEMVQATRYETTMQSPVGELLIAATDEGLVRIHFLGKDEPAPTNIASDHPVLLQAVAQLGEYFQGKRRTFDLPLAPTGTEFQLAAWRALEGIPFGETRSYGEQAKAIGRPKAVRAIGLANGKNPIAIVVPCHRVIGASGTLTGYGGGLDRKRALLEHEGALKAPLELPFSH